MKCIGVKILQKLRGSYKNKWILRIMTFVLFSGEKNIILLGNTEENIHTEKYLSKIPVKMKSKFLNVMLVLNLSLYAYF